MTDALPSTCRLCGGRCYPDPVLNLPGMPRAAQFFPTPEEFATDQGITLTISQCARCGLVQSATSPVPYFREVITAATLSGKSRQARLSLMREFIQTYGLAGRKIIEIGSGKGEMLEVIEEAGAQAWGLEASPSAVAVGRAAGRRLCLGYIGDTSLISEGPFDGFICLNYLEHLPEPGIAIQNIAANTTAEAFGLATVPNLEYLLQTKCFYEFVADHLSYFTASTLRSAFEWNGFEVLNCRTINNDNDLLAVVKKRQPLRLASEYAAVETLIKDLQRLAARYREQGKKIAVWGAGHRTLALLALAGMADLAFVVDSAPFKQGKFTPVLHRPIVAPDHLQTHPVDLLLIMVPGLYPGEVVAAVQAMHLTADLAILRDNRLEFLGPGRVPELAA